MNWVTRSIRQEQAVVVIPDDIEIVIPGKDVDSSSAPDQRPQHIRLYTEVKDGYLDVPPWVQKVRGFGRNLIDEVLLRGVPIFLRFGSR